jgi:AMMECR1 domain-containing protein
VTIFLIVVIAIAAGIMLIARAREQVSMPTSRSEAEPSRGQDQAEGQSGEPIPGGSGGAAVVDAYSDVLAELRGADHEHMERVILTLAQRFTEASVRGDPLPAARDVISASGVPDSVSGILYRRSAGVFVTIIRNNAVRACVGSIWAHFPSLAQEISHFAAAAAARDLRRSPIEAWELSRCSYAVSIVGRLERVWPGTPWDPRSYGVFVRAGARSGVILPGEALTHAKQISWALSEAGIDARMPYEMYRFQTVKFGGSLNLRSGLGLLGGIPRGHTQPTGADSRSMPHRRSADSGMPVCFGACHGRPASLCVAICDGSDLPAWRAG